MTETDFLALQPELSLLLQPALKTQLSITKYILASFNIRWTNQNRGYPSMTVYTQQTFYLLSQHGTDTSRQNIICNLNLKADFDLALFCFFVQLTVVDLSLSVTVRPQTSFNDPSYELC